MRPTIQALALSVSALALAGCGIFQSADSQQPQAQVTLRVADAAMASGAPGVALRVAQMVLDRQPNNVAAMVEKGDALYALGAAGQAREAYRAAVAADSDNVGGQIGLGRTLVRAAPHDAETHFLAALATQPDNVVALNNLGIAQDLQGHHEQAQEAYRKALAMDPEMADVKTNLGLSLALSGQAAQAVQVLQPVATAPDAGAMKHADLAVAVAQAHDVGPAGPVKVNAAQEATARYDAQLAISPAPISSVESEPLPPQAGQKNLLPEMPVAVAQPTPVTPHVVEKVVPLAAIAQPRPAEPAKAAGQGIQMAAAAVPPAAVVPEHQAGPEVKPAAILKPVEAVPAMEHPPRPMTTAQDGIYVQMASLNSEQDARTEWQHLRSRWPVLLGDRAPAVQQAEVHDRTFWRLRTGGFASVSDANDFCETLRAAGSGCWTVGVGARN